MRADRRWLPRILVGALALATGGAAAGGAVMAAGGPPASVAALRQQVAVAAARTEAGGYVAVITGTAVAPVVRVVVSGSDWAEYTRGPGGRDVLVGEKRGCHYYRRVGPRRFVDQYPLVDLPLLPQRLLGGATQLGEGTGFDVGQSVQEGATRIVTFTDSRAPVTVATFRIAGGHVVAAAVDVQGSGQAHLYQAAGFFDIGHPPALPPPPVRVTPDRLPGALPAGCS